MFRGPPCLRLPTVRASTHLPRTPKVMLTRHILKRSLYNDYREKSNYCAVKTKNNTPKKCLFLGCVRGVSPENDTFLDLLFFIHK